MEATNTETKKSWRDMIKVHPVADIFPMLPEDELRRLGEDIKQNGLKEALTVQFSADEIYLLDGRNRLAGMELVGLKPDDGWAEELHFHLFPRLQVISATVDSVAYVISKNIHRRHLTKE